MHIILSKPPKTPSEGLWEVLGWKTREKRRQLVRMVLVHRCVTREAPTNISQLVKTNAQIGNVWTRSINNLILPKVRTELNQRLFTFRASQDWNKLPTDVRDIGDPSEFKRRLRNTDFIQPIILSDTITCPICHLSFDLGDWIQNIKILLE